MAALAKVCEPLTSCTDFGLPCLSIATCSTTSPSSRTASGSPTPTVQWQRSINGGATWSNLTGATSTSFTTTGTVTSMSGYQYRAVFTNSAGKATSNAAILTVNP